VFNAGFVEASSDQFTFEITGDTSLESVDAMSEYTALGANPEDSDEEDEVYDPGEADGDPPNSDAEPEDVFEIPRDLLESSVSVEVEAPVDGEDNGEGEDGTSRNVKQKLAHPSSPRDSNAQIIPRGVGPVVEREVPGPPKLRVVVKDVAYATYRAVLYYVSPFPSLACVPLIILFSAVYGPYPFRAVVLILPLVMFVCDELRRNTKRWSGQPWFRRPYRDGRSTCWC